MKKVDIRGLICVLVVLAILLAARLAEKDRPTHEKKEPSKAAEEVIPTPIQFKCATLSPMGPGMKEAWDEHLAPAVVQATNRDLSIRMFWGGTMGGEDDYLRRMDNGKLDGALLMGRGLSEAAPELAVLELPFFYENYDEIDHVKDKMRSVFRASALARSFVLLALFDQGFEDLYSEKWDFSDPASFRKAVFANWQGELSAAVLKSLGAKTHPTHEAEIHVTICPRESPGFADSVLMPARRIVVNQLYVCMKAITVSNIRLCPMALVVREEAWNRLPEKKRTDLLEKLAALEEPVTAELRKTNKKAFRAMEEYGIKAKTMPPVAVKNLKVETAGLESRFVPKRSLDLVKGLVAQFRKREG